VISNLCAVQGVLLTFRLLCIGLENGVGILNHSLTNEDTILHNLQSSFTYIGHTYFNTKLLDVY